MNWYQVLIAHEGKKKDYQFAAEPSPRIEALKSMGLLLDLGFHADPVPPQEIPGTFGLEPQPTPEVKKRGRRGKSSQAGQDDGAQLQPPVGVESRDEGDGPHGGDGES